LLSQLFVGILSKSTQSCQDGRVEEKSRG